MAATWRALIPKLRLQPGLFDQLDHVTNSSRHGSERYVNAVQASKLFQADLHDLGEKLASTNIDGFRWSGNPSLFLPSMADNDDVEEEYRGTSGYFYADGPEFRLEYIHDRVEF